MESVESSSKEEDRVFNSDASALKNEKHSNNPKGFDSGDPLKAQEELQLVSVLSSSTAPLTTNKRVKLDSSTSSSTGQLHFEKIPVFKTVPREIRIMIFKVLNSTQDAIAFQSVDRLNASLLTKEMLTQHFLPLEEDLWMQVVDRYLILPSDWSIAGAKLRKREEWDNSALITHRTLREKNAFMWTNKIKASLERERGT